MIEYYNSLSGFSKTTFIIGIVMGVFLVIQLIMLIAGVDNDADLDADISDFEINEAGFGEIAGLKLLSVRTVVIFLCIGSWVAFTLDTNNVHMAVTIIVSILSGALVAFLFAFAMMKVMKLQGEGNIDLNNTIGLSAEVYLTIPADNARYGKINVLVQERMIEVDAKSADSEEIKTGEYVEVIDLINNIAIVRRKK